MQLNRNEPYSPVYGSSRAAFFQVVGKQGRYFAADGTEVPPGGPATVMAFVCPLTVPRSDTNPKGDRR